IGAAIVRLCRVGALALDCILQEIDGGLVRLYAALQLAEIRLAQMTASRFDVGLQPDEIVPRPPRVGKRVEQRFVFGHGSSLDIISQEQRSSSGTIGSALNSGSALTLAHGTPPLATSARRTPLRSFATLMRSGNGSARRGCAVRGAGIERRGGSAVGLLEQRH